MSCQPGTQDCGRFSPPQNATLAELVAWYRAVVLPRRNAEFRFYASLRDKGPRGLPLARVIEAAAMGETVYAGVPATGLRAGGWTTEREKAPGGLHASGCRRRWDS